MKQLNRLILVLVAGLMLAQCSTYKIKPDMNKSGVVNKTPKWYVDYKHETLFKSGTNEDLNVSTGSQDIIVNVIEDTLARGYEVTKQEMFLTKTKSYRVYVMIEVSKKEVEEIIAQANKNKLAVIDTDALNEAVDQVLN